jgi:hypothetical protein
MPAPGHTLVTACGRLSGHGTVDSRQSTLDITTALGQARCSDATLPPTQGRHLPRLHCIATRRTARSPMADG